MIEAINDELKKLQNILSIKKADLSIALESIHKLEAAVLAIEFMINSLEQSILTLGEKK